VAERLDDERIEILRSWGAGLATDPREEVRAAGKAITVLIEEIDRLQVDLWRSRMTPDRPVADLVESPADTAESPAPQPAFEPLPSAAAALRARLTLKGRPA
jgi:hypothetical protein